MLCGLADRTGMTSLVMSRLFPRARIYTFEPDPVTFHFLVHNLRWQWLWPEAYARRANRADNVMAFNVGMSSDGRDVAVSAAHLAETEMNSLRMTHQTRAARLRFGVPVQRTLPRPCDCTTFSLDIASIKWHS